MRIRQSFDGFFSFKTVIIIGNYLNMLSDIIDEIQSYNKERENTLRFFIEDNDIIEHINKGIIKSYTDKSVFNFISFLKENIQSISEQDIEKAKKDISNLVKIQKTITRGGRSFNMIYYIKHDDLTNHIKKRDPQDTIYSKYKPIVENKMKLDSTNVNKLFTEALNKKTSLSKEGILAAEKHYNNLDNLNKVKFHDQYKLVFGKSYEKDNKDIKNLSSELSDKGIQFLKESEGKFHSKKYDTKALKDKKGNLILDYTIGYGHKLTSLEISSGKININGKDVDYSKGITKDQGDDILKSDVSESIKDIKKLIKVSLKEYELDSLISFRFQKGLGGFKKSGIIKLINSGKMKEAADLLEKNGKRINRRKAEAEVFRGKSYLPPSYYENPKYYNSRNKKKSK